MGEARGDILTDKEALDLVRAYYAIPENQRGRLPVAPKTRLTVFAPAPNSGRLVLAKTAAPASRNSATSGSAAAAIPRP